MKFSVKYDVTKEKDANVIESLVLREFAAAYINQFKDKYSFEIIIEEVEEVDHTTKEKIKKTYAMASMEMINFKDVIKPKKEELTRTNKSSFLTKDSKEKSEGGV